MGVAIVLGIVVLVLVFGPLVLIWALNTLFGLAIAYTLKTWLAALLLGGLFSSGAAKSK